MKIKIDNKEIYVDNKDCNIVDITEANGISILAPCYKAKRKYGCCNVCMVKVNGELKFACVTKPVENMEVEINTDELIQKRKVAFEKYQENIKNGTTTPCSCDCNCSDDCC